jgi:hypothetical protein
MKAAILFALILASLPAGAERAASIEYELVARPAAIAAEALVETVAGWLKEHNL